MPVLSDNSNSNSNIDILRARLTGLSATLNFTLKITLRPEVISLNDTEHTDLSQHRVVCIHFTAAIPQHNSERTAAVQIDPSHQNEWISQKKSLLSPSPGRQKVPQTSPRKAKSNKNAFGGHISRERTHRSKKVSLFFEELDQPFIRHLNEGKRPKTQNFCFRLEVEIVSINSTLPSKKEKFHKRERERKRQE
ncbi:hypothetical protein NPIL_617531 [Nephila pilipes]|uniref:Uncharacterized protein n=1 Tax=Nephila pilipes TaxID=299642 RepID=A0A8X6TB02_NEPPI|nr:hypothetical protein NPIL_617531 [Nephila pilipes]